MLEKNINKNFDIGRRCDQQKNVDLNVVLKNSNVKSTLFSKGKKINSFFTEDSKLYISPKEQELIRKGVLLDRADKKWDSLSSKVVNNFVRYNPSASSLLLKSLEERYAMFDELSQDWAKNITGQFGLVRLWNASIIGSILFGMVMMTFVYRYLGQGASANIDAKQQATQVVVPAISTANTNEDEELFAKQVIEIQKASSSQSLEKEIRSMVKGYPIETMVPYIAKQDRTVAAFIVAIAKKESNWGKRVPVLNGQDCYNYWGYRGQRKLMGTGGHTCFNSPEDAINTVGKRIETLVNEKGKDTPAKMVLWKCGSSCAATGGQAAANKWISDVTMYFDKFNEDE